jgi:phage-related protein
MSIETFNWRTPSGASCTPQFRLLTAQFGDGYKQTAPDGLNTKSVSWSLSYTGKSSNGEIQSIIAFIDRHAGARSFYWTPPLGVQALFKGKYTSTHKGGDVYLLNLTFDQDFKP